MDPVTAISVRLRTAFCGWVVACALAASLVGCQGGSFGPNATSARYYQSGQYGAAAQVLQQQIARNPNDAESYYSLGRIYHTSGLQTNDQQQLYQAENFYNTALDHNPNHTAAYRSLAVLLTETNRPDKAFTLLSRWAGDPRNPPNGQAEARVELARLYEEFGDRRTAENYLQQAINLNGQNARAWTAIGKLREESGDYAQALANYQRSYQINRFQPAVGQRIALLERNGVWGANPTGTGAFTPTNTLATNSGSWGTGTSNGYNWGPQQPAWGGGPAPSRSPYSAPYAGGNRMVNAPGPMRRY